MFKVIINIAKPQALYVAMQIEFNFYIFGDFLILLSRQVAVFQFEASSFVVFGINNAGWTSQFKS